MQKIPLNTLSKNSPKLLEKRENLEKREKLGWKSPFEIYCRRKANELLSEGQYCDGAIDISEYIRPSAKDNKYHHKQTKSRGEKQKELKIKFLKECWIAMHAKIYTSYINVMIRCLFQLTQNRVIDKELPGDKGDDSIAI